MIEGESDELSLFVGARWQVGARVSLLFNSGFGLTEKADDFAPEIGLMFSF